MNNPRRKQIMTVIDSLDEIILDEQDAFDNLPENLAYSEKGEKMEETIDLLNEAKDLLEETI